MSTIMKLLAKVLGVAESVLVVDEVSVEPAARRAEAAAVKFTVFGSADEVQATEALIRRGGVRASLAAEILDAGITADVTGVALPTPDVRQVREGEVWELVDGVYILRECPPGFLKVNSTIDLQECVECEAETYAVDAEMGCGPDVCDNRACLPCPSGASCSSGGEPAWRHFVPEALMLGDALIPRARVVSPIGVVTLSCDGSACRPPETEAGQRRADGDEYLWEYSSDGERPGYVLKSCPPGHQVAPNPISPCFTMSLTELASAAPCDVACPPKLRNICLRALYVIYCTDIGCGGTSW